MPPVDRDRHENLRVSALERQLSSFTVSVLPDFFFDRILPLPSLRGLFKQAEAKAAAGGGSLRGYGQTEIRGGNASNLAVALAALSVNTRLYCIGDHHVLGMLTDRPKNCELRLIPGQPGFTVALEFPFRRRIANVMISDVGDLAHFDGKNFNSQDIACLKKSDAVALVNWSANLRGNELARRVFSLSGRKRRLNFLDPADLAGAEKRIGPLARMIADEGLIDVLSLNENEARIITKRLGLGRLPLNYRAHEVLAAAAKLHDELRVTVDIHTPVGSASASGGERGWESAAARVRGFVTGAGDVWDAGDIVGHLMNFSTRERLRFANANAYLYLASRKARLAGLKEVMYFMDGRSCSR